MSMIWVCDWVDAMVGTGAWSEMQGDPSDLLHSGHLEAKDCSFSVVTNWGADEQRETPSGERVLVAVVQQNCAQPVLRNGGHREAG